MAGRLKKLGIVDPVLTELARGYENEAFVGESLFPVVESAKEYGKVPQFGKEQFKIYETERAIRANSNIISPDDKDTIDFVMTEHDLGYPIDYREDDEDLFDSEENATNVVSEGIRLKHEYLCSQLATNLDNYAVNNKIELSGTSQFTHASSDPIGVIQDGKAKLKSKLGKNYGLTMLIGEDAYNALRKHAQLIEKIKYSMKGIITSDLMKEIFEVDNIVVGRATYLASNGDFANLWPDSIVLALVPKQAKSRYQPSFGYTIKKKGMPVMDYYFKEGNKVKIIRRTDIYTVKMLSNVAGYLISDTNA